MYARFGNIFFVRYVRRVPRSNLTTPKCSNDWMPPLLLVLSLGLSSSDTVSRYVNTGIDFEKFNTPPLRTGANESGLLFETDAFGGIVRVHWESTLDSSAERRFDRIPSVWIYDPSTSDDSKEARLITNVALISFFESLFYQGNLNKETANISRLGVSTDGVVENPFFKSLKELNTNGRSLLRSI
ncbi:hypothetical protein K438DRAFT_1764028 [Mycena galopus ATCC 62051]|nr:hypothetical protein K438DRAFT_1764028 [Mycena galopus ATCC 62051]